MLMINKDFQSAEARWRKGKFIQALLLEGLKISICFFELEKAYLLPGFVAGIAARSSGI